MSRTRQPTGIVRINPRIPQPSFVFCPSAGLMDWTKTSRVGTKAAGDSVIATPYGIGYKVARASQGGLDFGTTQALTGDAWTILVFANPSSSTAVGAMFSQRNGSSPFNQVDLVANSRSGLAANAGSLALIHLDTSTAGRDVYVDGVVNGNWNVYASTHAVAASYPTLWVNGVLKTVTGTGTGTGTQYSTAQKLRIGNLADISGDTYCSAETYPLVVAWNSVLPDALLRRANPDEVYDLVFPPSRRIWVQLGAATTGGTGTTATLAATDGADIAALAATQTSKATLAATDGADLAALTAAHATPITGTFAAIDGADAATLTASQTSVATLAATDGADLAALTAIHGNATAAQLVATDGADAASLTAGQTSKATIAATDGADICAFAANSVLAIVATFAATDGADSALLYSGGQSIWTDVGVSATTWGDVGGATSIWTDL